MDGTRLTRRQQKGGATSEGEGQVVVRVIEIRVGFFTSMDGIIFALKKRVRVSCNVDSRAHQRGKISTSTSYQRHTSTRLIPPSKTPDVCPHRLHTILGTQVTVSPQTNTQAEAARTPLLTSTPTCTRAWVSVWICNCATLSVLVHWVLGVYCVFEFKILSHFMQCNQDC